MREVPSPFQPEFPDHKPAGGIRLRWFAVALALVFALALGLGWLLFAPSRPPASPTTAASTGSVDEERLAAFLAAARQADYGRLRDLGEELFLPGVRIPDSRRRLEDYATNSFVPYSVYVLFTSIEPDRTRRVLLTLDEEERVVSFLAEEMAITK
ncbi:MAG: hypothetical protein LIP77_08430 [Planctomycetes bacterium]|nr:hypothetical protein [Planctomycetota bacterium]